MGWKFAYPGLFRCPDSKNNVPGPGNGSKKLLPHHVEDVRREGEQIIEKLSNSLAKEQDTLQSAMKEKYGIEVESQRQKWNREAEEEDRRMNSDEEK